MLIFLPKILGALGLLLITWGIFVKNDTKQAYFFAAGGLLLLIYSIYLKDLIFIPLQTIFTLASIYKIKKTKQKQ